jgi:hypothetical protein
MRQSVRGHSAAVWPGRDRDMQGVHPAMYHLWMYPTIKDNLLSTGNFTVHLLESRWKICRMVPLESSRGGRSVEK